MKALKVIPLLFVVNALASSPTTLRAADESIFDRKNIVGWCIVSYDAKKRGPEERAKMLDQLGLKKLAYNWNGRGEPIPSFDAEVEAMQRHGIELTACWYPERMPQTLEVIKRHGIHPQLWVCGLHAIAAYTSSGAQRIEDEAARIRPIAKDAAELDCQVGLYNHRGEPWFEEQDNQIALIERLRRDGLTNVGIVFNFHHWRGSLNQFPALFKRIQPYLLAVNLNGMPVDATQYANVRFLGTDEAELAMMRVVQESGWQGPVGIINEHNDLDAAEALARNLAGLDWLKKELHQSGSGGPKPTETTPLAPQEPKPQTN